MIKRNGEWKREERERGEEEKKRIYIKNIKPLALLLLRTNEKEDSNERN